MLEKIKQLINKRQEAYTAFREAYDKACEDFSNELMKVLPYESQYVKIQSSLYGFIKYIKVIEIFKHGDEIIIRGYGFHSEFTEYADATYAIWDYMCSHELKIDEIEKEISSISIITEKEFTEAFQQMINQMQDVHLATITDDTH
jgi:predicted  nucleic acid-binding Zn-ribbon protein